MQKLLNYARPTRSQLVVVLVMALPCTGCHATHRASLTKTDISIQIVQIAPKGIDDSKKNELSEKQARAALAEMVLSSPKMFPVNGKEFADEIMKTPLVDRNGLLDIDGFICNLSGRTFDNGIGHGHFVQNANDEWRAEITGMTFGDRITPLRPN